VTIRQRSGPQGGPAVVRTLGPVLRIVATVRDASRGRRRRSGAVRRRSGHTRRALRLVAGTIGLAGPHRLRHPVKVTAVDEDTRATTSVEADRGSLVVELDGHQRHAHHALCVEVLAHRRGLCSTRLSCVDEAVVDPLDGELFDSHADCSFHIRGDVLAHFISCLRVREVGPVEDLDCERIDTLDLTIHHLVRLSELEDVVPREARLGRPCVDAIDVPLL